MEWAMVTALCAVCGLLGGGGTYFVKRGSQEAASMLKAASAEALANACLAKLELTTTKLSERLAELERQDAASFARLDVLVGENGKAQLAAENRLVQSLDEVKGSIERMTERFDRFMLSGKP
jgi:hypothetical protein